MGFTVLTLEGLIDLREASGRFRELQEASGSLRRRQEASGSLRKPQEAAGGPARPQEAPGGRQGPPQNALNNTSERSSSLPLPSDLSGFLKEKVFFNMLNDFRLVFSKVDFFGAKTVEVLSKVRPPPCAPKRPGNGAGFATPWFVEAKCSRVQIVLVFANQK